jgi:hypothetical protein
MEQNIDTELIKKMEQNSNFVISNYSKLKDEYGNKFIAVDNGKIIGHEKNMKGLIEQLEREKIDLLSVFVRFIPSKGIEILY